jgi:hypothetical protein
MMMRVYGHESHWARAASMARQHASGIGQSIQADCWRNSELLFAPATTMETPEQRRGNCKAAAGSATPKSVQMPESCLAASAIGAGAVE